MTNLPSNYYNSKTSSEVEDSHLRYKRILTYYDTSPFTIFFFSDLFFISQNSNIYQFILFLYVYSSFHTDILGFIVSSVNKITFFCNPFISFSTEFNILVYTFRYLLVYTGTHRHLYTPACVCVFSR